MSEKFLEELHWHWLEREFKQNQKEKIFEKEINDFVSSRMTFDDFTKFEKMTGDYETHISEMAFAAGYKTCLKILLYVK